MDAASKYTSKYNFYHNFVDFSKRKFQTVDHTIYGYIFLSLSILHIYMYLPSALFQSCSMGSKRRKTQEVWPAEVKSENNRSITQMICPNTVRAVEWLG